MLISDLSKTILESLQGEGVFIDAPCSGKGHCGKCKVKIEGKATAVSDAEYSLLSENELSQGIRLACLCKPLEPCAVSFITEKNIKIQIDSVKIMPCNDYKKGEIGMAVDVGTTTVAAYFYDLYTGELLNVFSAVNEQKSFGADVISRIDACKNDGVLKRLQNIIVKQINGFIKQSGYAVKDAVITGNTVMLHLLTELDPAGIAQSPFVPQSLFSVEYLGEQLGLDIKRNVYLPPCISAYVGADVAAGLIACLFDENEHTCLFTDFGTNGELALLHNGEILCCATAAGPAFEGANITNGTASVSGAINRVWWEVGVQYTTIDGEPAVGICGSGLLDAVAVLVQQGIVDETGYMDDDFLIGGIALTPKDIRQVQLAKSAVASGIDCLLKEADIAPSDIDFVYVAGGFGANISPASAEMIGLFRHEFKGKYKVMGNTSGIGASQALLSVPMKERLEQLPVKCRYIELSGDGYFNERYMENMMFF